MDDAASASVIAMRSLVTESIESGSIDSWAWGSLVEDAAASDVLGSLRDVVGEDMLFAAAGDDGERLVTAVVQAHGLAGTLQGTDLITGRDLDLAREAAKLAESIEGHWHRVSWHLRIVVARIVVDLGDIDTGIRELEAVRLEAEVIDDGGALGFVISGAIAESLVVSDPQQGLEAVREWRDTALERFGADSSEAAMAMAVLARSATALDQQPDAEELWRQAVAAAVAAEGEDSRLARFARLRHAEMLVAGGQGEADIADARSLRAALDADPTAPRELRVRSAMVIASTLADRGDLDGAIALNDELTAGAPITGRGDDQVAASLRAAASELWIRRGEPERARELVTELVAEVGDVARRDGAPRRAWVIAQLARLRVDGVGVDADVLDAHARSALVELSGLGGDHAVAAVHAIVDAWSRAALAIGGPIAADRASEAGIAVLDTMPDVDASERALLQLQQADRLIDHGDPARALVLAESADEVLSTVLTHRLGAAHVRAAGAIVVARALIALGRPEAAIEPARDRLARIEDLRPTTRVERTAADQLRTMIARALTLSGAEITAPVSTLSAALERAVPRTPLEIDLRGELLAIRAMRDEALDDVDLRLGELLADAAGRRPQDPRLLARLRTARGIVAHRDERHEDSLAWFTMVFEAQRDVMPDTHEEIDLTIARMAIAAAALGRHERERELRRDRLERATLRPGVDPEFVAVLHQEIGVAARTAGDCVESIRWFELAAEHLDGSVGGADARTLWAIGAAGAARIACGDAEDGFGRLTLAVEGLRAAGAEHRERLLRMQAVLADALEEVGDLHRALELRRELATAWATFSPLSVEELTSASRLVILLDRLELGAEAAVLEEAVAVRYDEAGGDVDVIQRAAWRSSAAERWLVLGDAARAVEGFTASAAALAAGLGEDHPSVLTERISRTRALWAAERFEECAASAEALLDRSRRVLGDGSPSTVEVWMRLGFAREQVPGGAAGEGIRLLTSAVAAAVTAEPKGEGAVFGRRLLAQAHAEAHHWDEAAIVLEALLIDLRDAASPMEEREHEIAREFCRLALGSKGSFGSPNWIGTRLRRARRELGPDHPVSRLLEETHLEAVRRRRLAIVGAVAIAGGTVAVLLTGVMKSIIDGAAP